MSRRLFTSESVSMGHPDKVADQISDAVLDHCLAADPTSRVACETLVTTDLVVIAGEVTSKADLSAAAVEKIARDAVREIGYVDPRIGFAADTCKVHCHLHAQSPHIAMGVDVGGAGHILGWYSERAGEIAEDRVFRQDARGTIWTGRRPMGVTGVIVPWNSPVYLAFLGIAPALLAGNTVVVKPSEFAPLTLSAVLEVVAVHLPAGVLNVVPGGGEAGAAIAAHPRVRKVFFTGSTATGMRIMERAAKRLAKVSLECGGKFPAIITEDADLERCLDAVTYGAFMYGGIYKFPAYHFECHGVFTNKTPTDAYRGAGRPEATFAVERIMDELAIELGMNECHTLVVGHVRSLRTAASARAGAHARCAISISRFSQVNPAPAPCPDSSAARYGAGRPPCGALR